MPDSNQPPTGDVEAREAAVDQEWQYLCEKDDRTSPAEFPDMALITRDELGEAISQGINAYLAKLTSTKPEPSRIADAELVELIQALRSYRELCKGDSRIWSPSTVWCHFENAADNLSALSAHITDIEADRDRMREALEWIRDELPDRDDWDNFEEYFALVLRMRAKARAALKSSKPGEG